MPRPGFGTPCHQKKWAAKQFVDGRLRFPVTGDDRMFGISARKSESVANKCLRFDFIQCMQRVQRRGDPKITDLAWKEVQSHLASAALKIEIRIINGTAGDILDYRDHGKGLNVIAIGGEKLSRGLTLEGLTVSYFLRATKMYDTLMQIPLWIHMGDDRKR